MIDLIYITLSFLTLYYFYRKKYTKFIVLFFTVISNVWGVFPASKIIFDYDQVNLITFGTLLIAFSRNRYLFSTKKDIVGRLILILVGYFFLVCLLSPLRGVESLYYSMMVFRFDFFYLLYFVFKMIPPKNFRDSIPKLLKYTIFSGILYFLQFAGISFYQEVELVGTEYARFANIPMLTKFMFFYLFLAPDKMKHRLFWVAFFFAMIVLSQSRGVLMGVVGSIIVLILFRRRLLQTKVVLITLIVALMLSGVIMYRLSDSGSTGGGIKEEVENVEYLVKSNDYSSYDSRSVHTEGTFFFRVAMILERIDYLAQSPIDLIFGAGAYHERSASVKRLPFVLGSNAGEYRTKVETDDVALLSHFFRCGLLYILIYLLFLYKSFRIVWNNKELWSQVCAVMLLSAIINAISGEVFFRVKAFGIVLLLLAYCRTMTNRGVVSNNSVFIS